MASDLAQSRLVDKALAAKKKLAVRPGGIQAFHDGLIFEPVVSDEEYEALVINPGNAQKQRKARQSVKKKLEDFYPVFEKCFPISEEREPKANLKGLLTEDGSLFDPKKMHDTIGDYREFAYVIRDPQTKEPIGGLEFTVYLHEDSTPTLASTYAFLASEYRNLGLVRSLVDHTDKTALNYVKNARPDLLDRYRGIYSFSEQNIPELMPAIKYAKDSSEAIDPVKRLKIWSRFGYSRLQLDYVQPPLEEGGELCAFLSLNTYFRKAENGATGSEVSLGEVISPDNVDPRIVRKHIRAFCLQNNCKNPEAGTEGSEHANPATISMLRDLQGKIDKGQVVQAIPPDQSQELLDMWAARVKALKAILGRTPLNERTIEELYAEHQEKVDLLIKNNFQNPGDLQSREDRHHGHQKTPHGRTRGSDRKASLSLLIPPSV